MTTPQTPQNPTLSPAETERAETLARQARWGEALRWTGLIVLLFAAGALLHPPSTETGRAEKVALDTGHENPTTDTPAQAASVRRKSHPPASGEVRSFGSQAPTTSTGTSPTDEPAPSSTRRVSHPPAPGEVRSFGPAASSASAASITSVATTAATPESEPKQPTERRKIKPPAKGEVRSFGGSAAPASPTPSTENQPAQTTVRRQSHPPTAGQVRSFGAAASSGEASPVAAAKSAAASAGTSERGEIVSVEATVETDPVETKRDAADDPAIWVNPTDAGKSLVISTNKKAGMRIYDLAGHQVQVIDEIRPNNVDVLYAFAADGTPADLAIASDITTNSILIYRIDPKTGKLTPGTPARVQTSFQEIYGICACTMPSPTSSGTGVGYVIINDKEGHLEQWQAAGDPRGWVTWTKVRTFRVETQCEGMVADPANNSLYVDEEDVAIWRFELDPASTSPPTAVDFAQPKGRFAPDAEGITCVRTSERGGYLITSSQGDGTFLIYRREPPNTYVGSFRIRDDAAGKIDGVSETDGIDATSAALGAAFPHGLFVCQDGKNPDANQNFKYVPWERLASAFTPPLEEQPKLDPRPAKPAIDR